MKVAGVIIYNNHAYVPTDAQMKSGPYLSVEPVQVAELDVESLGSAIQKAYDKGNPQIEDVNHKEYSKNDPTLKATGARSWQQLAKGGASYGIQWTDEHIEIWISKLDDKGRFVTDSNKTQQFPANASTNDIANVILRDWQSRV